MEELRQRFARVFEAIEADLARPAEISVWARQAGYSTWHFQKVFAALVGEPVASYHRRRRLTEAARQLRIKPARRVLDIALDVGFESHEAFTRAFRQVSGHTPSAFRRERSHCPAWTRSPQKAEHLTFIPPIMNLEPTLENRPALSLVGLSARFISANSPDANNLEVIPPLWEKLMKRRVELAAAADQLAFGACRMPDEPTREGEMEYLAGFELPVDAPVPEGMVRWEIPATQYARFTHRGPIGQFPQTLQYVYGSWFPRSNFEPTGIELEIYDERFSPHGEDSELDYLVAIQNRSR